jgi:polyhydroxyalkanoate synthase
VALGQSPLQPAKGDRRFADPASTSNPLARRLMQSYLASASALNAIVDELGATFGDRVRRRRR